MLKKLLTATAVITACTCSTVQAANVLDLTFAGANGSINGSFFQQVNPQSTGTGVIDSFVRIQNNGTEQGFNTDGTPQFDTKSGVFTHSLLKTDLQAFNLNTSTGVGTADPSGAYFRFLLDLNQLGANPLL